ARHADDGGVRGEVGGVVEDGRVGRALGEALAAFEGLGTFYLGAPVDPETGQRLAERPADAPVLYDAADLTTHAAIIGMTGSGKTGLGIGLIEEAALDRIPVIAVDPKGDLGNLLLTFPDLAPSDFAPWVDAQEAQRQGRTPDEHAAATADLWTSGLAKWGQAPERIQRLRDTADLAIYTPGSSAGLPLSVLRSFDPPGEALREDADLYRERIEATVSGVLALAGVEADPLQDPEHVFLARVVGDTWTAGRSLTLADLIRALQAPPFEQLGVLDVDTFFPARDRGKLAMRLNGLLASPGFAAWGEGEPLDVARLLHKEDGTPRVSILSIAHLGESERQFFVTKLLTEVIAWMRQQPGTGSLRALLYMDEVFGYLPPQGNPPTKPLFLTLLKQARAYGLGLVLATQNPVDLDYKALSNCGTWFVGRLQTERDKARLLDGLEGATPGGLDRSEMDTLLSGLGKRRFLLHNVHESAPQVFETRWVLSYLAGPLTRTQIGTLMEGRGSEAEGPVSQVVGRRSQVMDHESRVTSLGGADDAGSGARPVVPSDVPEVFLAPTGGVDGGGLTYVPMLLAHAEVPFARKSLDLDHTAKTTLLAEIDSDEVDYESAESLTAKPATESAPRDGAAFAALPSAMSDAGSYGKWERALKRWLQHERPLTVFQHKGLKAVSQPGEDERAFRARLADLARADRDRRKTDLRERFQKKLDALETKMRAAEERVAREESQASQKKLDTVVNVGVSLLGAFLGSRRMSRTTVNKIGTAARSAGRMRKESDDVARAEKKLDDLRAQYADLDAELLRELEMVDLDAPEIQPLETVEVKAKQTDMHVETLALAWVPYAQDTDGRLRRA
ncbi:MAG: DUF87 domain-containing protein, partial [Bacteroidota bacterium]